MSAQLPEKPDFLAIEAVSHASADKRTMILALIGNMVFSWSNNESMFIYVLMLLLNTDQNSAVVVFGTLNTTRARIDLVQRLAMLKIKDKAIIKELNKLISRFNDCTKARNEFNHCMYTVDEHGEITHTHAMKIQEVKGNLQLGSSRKMDDARIKEMLKIIKDLRKLNRDLWDFLPRLKAHLGV